MWKSEESLRNILYSTDYWSLIYGLGALQSLGRNSSVGIATRYGLDSPGIESRCGARFSAPVRNCSGTHPASYTMGTGSFPGVQRQGCSVDHPPTSNAKVKESKKSVPLLHFWAFVACYRVKFTFTFTLRFKLDTHYIPPEFSLFILINVRSSWKELSYQFSTFFRSNPYINFLHSFEVIHII
jgi:hypothetical protein